MKLIGQIKQKQSPRVFNYDSLKQKRLHISCSLFFYLFTFTATNTMRLKHNRTQLKQSPHRPEGHYRCTRPNYWHYPIPEQHSHPRIEARKTKCASKHQNHHHDDAETSDVIFLIKKFTKIHIYSPFYFMYVEIYVEGASTKKMYSSNSAVRALYVQPVIFSKVQSLMLKSERQPTILPLFIYIGIFPSISLRCFSIMLTDLEYLIGNNIAILCWTNLSCCGRGGWKNF